MGLKEMTHVVYKWYYNTAISYLSNATVYGIASVSNSTAIEQQVILPYGNIFYK